MVEESDNLIEKQKKYFMLIGVSVYEGQAIEYKLKKLSKFIHPNIDDALPEITKEDFLAREKILEKRTLGFIFNYLKEKKFLLNDNAEFLVNKFVNDRNTVIHHLVKLPGFNLNTEEGIDRGIQFLGEYRKTIKDINDIFDPIFISVHTLLYENVDNIGDMNKYQNSLSSLLNESLARAGGSLEIEVLNNLDERFDYQIKNNFNRNDDFTFNPQAEKNKLWQNTKIVRALSRIGAEIANQDGWIFLSICEQRLKTEYPEIKPNDYGFKNILEIIKISNLFEFKKTKSKKHNKYKIYFRFHQETNEIS
ncbi:OST-HTH/LOTUS domain-containing protein [Nostoc sp. UHCC 0252]|uniref:OST-HTH/LOTUS domain-containing protein n=1 Tax=Nostoc sp. UHCC 0252 TaxID=3110241 RepID=UPI002B2064AF|nr:OST-HTH/LOTUS domain-containing protein [Nostoc sp. UHCC 0252]MEA5603060.1 OST-HTH/LOTUS domain-containing protein [Nostoc sp. UHCC 0252]